MVAAAVRTSTTASDRVEVSTARTLWGSTMRTAVTMSTPARAASGIWETRPPRNSTISRSTTAWTTAASAGAGPSADVHRGASDRAGGGHAAEQRRDQVRESLAEQLTVRVVPGPVGHPVGDLRGQQTLDRSEQRDREAGRHQLADLSGRRVRQRRQRQRPGQRPDASHVQAAHFRDDRCDDDREQRRRRCALDPHRHDHRGDDHGDDADRGEAAGDIGAPESDCVTDRSRRDRCRVLPVRLRHTESGRDLLQEDDHRDPDREPLHDGPRDVREVAAHPRERGDEHEHAGDEPDDEHRVGAVTGDDRDEHHRHRPGRPRHLHVRPAEHGRDEPGDDRGDQPRLRAETGRDPERERQRQRDDTDRHPGDEIVADRPS